MTVVEIEKQDAQKNMSKRKLTYANYKNCLEATQLNNNQIIQKKKILIDSLHKKIKEFIKKQQITITNTAKM